MVDDDLPSVRIEVDGASTPVVEAPDAAIQRGGQSRWSIVLVALLVVGVGAVLFSLSPGGDEAGDGTERNVPATESESTQGTALDRTESDANSNGTGPVVLPRLDEQLMPVEVEVPLPLGQVIETADGLIAVAGEQGAERPLLLRSIDGLEWDQIETSISSSNDRELGEIQWSQLFQTSNGFELIGAGQDEVLRTELASSTNAVDWTVTNDDPVSALLGPFGQPIAVLEDSVVAVRFRTQPIEDVLSTLTDVQLEGRGVCNVIRTPEGPNQLLVFSCTGLPSAVLEASNVLPGNDAGQVLECVLSLGGQQGGIAAAFVEVGREDRIARSFGDESSRWSPVALPMLLQSGSLAFVDPGVAESPACAEVIDLDPLRAPSIVVLDAEPQGETLVPLPVELDDGQGLGSIFGVEILGETTTFADGSSHLLVTIGEELWSLNLRVLEWTLLYDTTDEVRVFRFGNLMLSANGNRIYQPTIEGLRILELDEGADGVLAATVGVAQVDGPRGFSANGLLRAEANYATNNWLLVTDESSGRVWSIIVPPPEDERRREFVEDLGGVGVARVR